MSQDNKFTRRTVLKAGAASGVLLATPTILTNNAWAAGFANDPGNAKSIMLGFNVPQTGAYADEGADELRAYQLAVKHYADSQQVVQAGGSHRFEGFNTIIPAILEFAKSGTVSSETMASLSAID